jgi:hypothetical protein
MKMGSKINYAFLMLLDDAYFHKGDIIHLGNSKEDFIVVMTYKNKAWRYICNLFTSSYISKYHIKIKSNAANI